MKGIAALCLLVAVSLVGCGGGTTGPTRGASNTNIPVTGNISIVAGTIRQSTADRTKWSYISNTGHTPIGVSGSCAVATGDSIKITYDRTYSKVVTFIVAPDETLASSYNMSTGASVGLSSATIKASGIVNGSMQQLMLDGTGGSDSLALNRGNIWFVGIFEE